MVLGTGLLMCVFWHFANNLSLHEHQLSWTGHVPHCQQWYERTEPTEKTSPGVMSTLSKNKCFFGRSRVNDSKIINPKQTSSWKQPLASPLLCLWRQLSLLCARPRLWMSWQTMPAVNRSSAVDQWAIFAARLEGCESCPSAALPPSNRFSSPND